METETEIVEHYLYSKDHEWVNIEDNTATMGITEYAQNALGDITFAELPSVGAEVDQFEECASVESVKAASDIYAPMSGKVVEVNDELESDPSLINKSPYDKGWIAKLEIVTTDETSDLMGAKEYRKFIEGLDS